MEQILLPTKIEITRGKGHEYTLIVEPCHPGYGVTLGNALRRLLLSSLTGAAVTDVKIKGADHEFGVLPHIKEDILDLVLNLKKLRMKVHSDEPVRLKLRVKGEKEATAADFERNAEVEIADPDFHVATLTDKAAELDMEIIVRRGRGASPIEEREKKDREIGLIAVDAIFSPVKIVGYKIENVRVGQQTNYEKLIFDFETDGSITGEEALKETTQLLLDHFNLILGVGKALRVKAPSAAKVSENKEKTEEKKKEEEEETAGKEKKKRGRPKKK